jgi:hypothetical protein
VIGMNDEQTQPTDLSNYIEFRPHDERPYLRGRCLVSIVISYLIQDKFNLQQVKNELNLSNAQIAAALLYYEEHKAEVDAAEQAFHDQFDANYETYRKNQLDQELSGLVVSDFFSTLYAAFNARDIETALAILHPDVVWPNGMEGGYVYGQGAVRDYWTRQWSMIDPQVEPVNVAPDETGHLVVDVHQIVRDLAGNVIADQRVQHVYSIKNGLVRSMEICKPENG